MDDTFTGEATAGARLPRPGPGPLCSPGTNGGTMVNGVCGQSASQQFSLTIKQNQNGGGQQ